MRKKGYVYHVVYHFFSGSDDGIGQSKVTSDRKIKYWSQLEELMDAIKEENKCDTVYLISWNRLKG